MTAIHQNSISSHHTVDDTSNRSDSRNEDEISRGRQVKDVSTQDKSSSTVNISYNAELRLKAFQEQRMMQMNQSLSDFEQPTISDDNILVAHNRAMLQPKSVGITDNHQFVALEDNKNSKQPGKEGNANSFPQHISVMLSEVEDNIVQTTEPGYRYLVNVLNNYKDNVEQHSQLQEIMRKEQFFLNRRKPFMDNADFQSYSQVLSQFSNIVERQQYSS